MFVIAIGLLLVSSLVICFKEFGKMSRVSRVFMVLQLVALAMMVVAWLGISF
jgi:hypothetical protein